MNLLLAHEHEVEEGQLVVSGRRARHAREVLRATVGDTLRIGIARQSVGQGQVLEIHDERIVIGALALNPIPKPQLSVILALPRPKALRRLLQTVASFGVAHIDLVNAWRVDKSYWKSPAVEVEAMQEQLWLGCEQGGSAWLPSITTHRFLVPYLEAMEAKTEVTKIVMHPNAGSWLHQRRSARDESAVLAFGPEGGWIGPELESLATAGFLKCSLSEATLRSEIAIAAAFSQWELLSQILDN